MEFHRRWLVFSGQAKIGGKLVHVVIGARSIPEATALLEPYVDKVRGVLREADNKQDRAAGQLRPGQVLVCHSRRGQLVYTSIHNEVEMRAVGLKLNLAA